jgi:hypothetical protein
MSSFIYCVISIGYDMSNLDDSEVFPFIHGESNYRPPKPKLMGKEMVKRGRGSKTGRILLNKISRFCAVIAQRDCR